MRRSFPTAIILLMAPVSSWSQVGNAPAVYGNGEVPQLRYGDAAAVSNLVSLKLEEETGYDSNVPGLSAPRFGSTFFALGPSLEVLQQRAHLVFDLYYQPNFLFYPSLSQYNRLNQALTLDTSYRFGPRLTLRVRDSFSYQTGTSQPGSKDSPLDGLGPPTTLNQIIYTPFAPQIVNGARVDAIYQENARTSFTMFGGFNRLQFTGQPAAAQQYYDTRGVGGGFQYTYRLSEHLSFGALYLFQSLNFQGNLGLGSPSRVSNQSVLTSFAWRLSPSVTLSVFGGPQCVQNRFPNPSVVNSGVANVSNLSFPAHWDVAAGGSLSKQSDRTALSLSAQRMVADGGGWMTAATNSFVNLGLRRLLARRWNANLGLGVGRTDGIIFPYKRNSVTMETAALNLEHSLGERVTARLAYTFVLQNNNGPAAAAAQFDRSRISLGLFYEAKSFSLRR
jgi:hypothetical protein